MARNKDEESEQQPADDEQEQDPQASRDDEDASSDDDEATSDDGDTASSDGGEEDINEITAPSVGPHTTFEKEGHKERLARHEQSDVDAMGHDKRREVIGGSYSPSVGRQLFAYGLFVLVVGLIVAGALFAVSKLDQPEDKYVDKAPWSQADAEQIKPTEIDFPNYGHPGPSEEPQATPGEQQGAATSENVTGAGTSR